MKVEHRVDVVVGNHLADVADRPHLNRGRLSGDFSAA
jgi:hypothetical protein